MRILFAIFSISFILFACNQGKSPSAGATILPGSTGGADEIMFVLPDHLYTDEITGLINSNFSESYKVLPQPEERFTISIIKSSQLNSLLYRFRNIIFVSSYDTRDAVTDIALDVLGEEDFGQKKPLVYKRNVWAKSQLITFAFAPSQKELKDFIETYSPQISNTISNAELEAYKKLAYINGVNTKLRDQLIQLYGLSFDVPVNFKIATNEGSFISFRGDNEKSTFYLFFDVVKMQNEVQDENRGIEFRDARGKYVSSNLEGTYVQSDSLLGFFSNRFERDGFIIYENRGLWTMINDFMGGPFINHYIIDQKNNRIILLDGFVYGPGDKNKIKLMRQFEAIFTTLKPTE